MWSPAAACVPPFDVVNLPLIQGSSSHTWRAKLLRPNALFELAVFAAPAVEPDVHGTAVTRRLTLDARPNPRKHPPARFGDLLAAFEAMGLCHACRHACPRSHDSVHDGIVDLILNRPVGGPPVRHHRIQFAPLSIALSGLLESKGDFRNGADE
jgi:hypothetical protein